MERDTPLYSEMTFAVTMLHRTYEEYVDGRSEESRMLHTMWYNLYRAKESYHYTPQDQRFGFLSR